MDEFTQQKLVDQAVEEGLIYINDAAEQLGISVRWLETLAARAKILLQGVPFPDGDNATFITSDDLDKIRNRPNQRRKA